MMGRRTTEASKNRSDALCIGGTEITNTRIAIQVLPQMIDKATMARTMRSFMRDELVRANRQSLAKGEKK